MLGDFRGSGLPLTLPGLRMRSCGTCCKLWPTMEHACQAGCKGGLERFQGDSWSRGNLKWRGMVDVHRGCCQRPLPALLLLARVPPHHPLAPLHTLWSLLGLWSPETKARRTPLRPQSILHPQSMLTVSASCQQQSKVTN